MHVGSTDADPGERVIETRSRWIEPVELIRNGKRDGERLAVASHLSVCISASSGPMSSGIGVCSRRASLGLCRTSVKFSFPAISLNFTRQIWANYGFLRLLSGVAIEWNSNAWRWWTCSNGKRIKRDELSLFRPAFEHLHKRRLMNAVCKILKK